MAGASGGLGRSLVPNLIAAGHQIADDDPAPASVWLPELAHILGAKPPRHVPAWLVVGEMGVSLFTKVRAADNTLVKQTFDWQPGYASWREGFRHGL